MFTIVVDRPGQPADHLVSDSESLTIGSAAGNDVVIAEADAHHATVDTFEDRMILMPKGATRVAGKPVTGITPLAPNTGVELAGVTVTIAMTYVEASETALLAAIGRGDDASRIVYADWLEQRGFAIRAEFVRVQSDLHANPHGATFVARSGRLRDLAARLPLTWRYKLARPVLEGCDVAFELACPKDWGSLTATGSDGVRHCGTCNKQVRFCATVSEARMYAREGSCVAIDVLAMRAAGDLAPAPAVWEAPPFTCQRCGHSQPATPARPRCSSCGSSTGPENIESDVRMGAALSVDVPSVDPDLFRLLDDS